MDHELWNSKYRHWLDQAGSGEETWRPTNQDTLRCEPKMANRGWILVPEFSELAGEGPWKLLGSSGAATRGMRNV